MARITDRGIWIETNKENQEYHRGISPGQDYTKFMDSSGAIFIIENDLIDRIHAVLEVERNRGKVGNITISNEI